MEVTARKHWLNLNTFVYHDAKAPTHLKCHNKCLMTWCWLRGLHLSNSLARSEKYDETDITPRGEELLHEWSQLSIRNTQVICFLFFFTSDKNCIKVRAECSGGFRQQGNWIQTHDFVATAAHRCRFCTLSLQHVSFALHWSCVLYAGIQGSSQTTYQLQAPPPGMLMTLLEQPCGSRVRETLLT